MSTPSLEINNTDKSSCYFCHRLIFGMEMSWKDYIDLSNREQWKKTLLLKIGQQCKNCSITICSDCLLKDNIFEYDFGRGLQCPSCGSTFIGGDVLVKIVSVQVGQTIDFPNVCVHCLQPATTTRSWESIRHTEGSKVDLVAAKLNLYKAQNLEIPYCKKHIEDLRRYEKVEENSQVVLVLSGFGIVVGMIFLHLAFFTELSSTVLPILYLVILAPLLLFVPRRIANLYRRSQGNPQKISRGVVVSSDKGLVQFSFSNPQYAEMFEDINTMIIQS